MKKFIINTSLFALTGMLLGEIIVRMFYLTPEIPRRTVDENHIQKYIPNQKGYWKGGNHTWQINKMGWPGALPDSFDNLIFVMGDSFIENFMNPSKCRQRALLKNQLTRYNFIEAGRSGISFIEALEISRYFDSLHPRYYLMYVKEGDFTESIQDIRPLSDITQVSLTKNRIIPGVMKTSILKNVLYSWKFLYYLYNRFPLRKSTVKKLPEPVEGFAYASQIELLFAYVTKNYQIQNKILVFRPDSQAEIIELAQKAGFQTIVLENKEGKPWSFEHDSHWTCYGHEQAATQVAQRLKHIQL